MIVSSASLSLSVAWSVGLSWRQSCSTLLRSCPSSSYIPLCNLSICVRSPGCRSTCGGRYRGGCAAVPVVLRRFRMRRCSVPLGSFPSSLSPSPPLELCAYPSLLSPLSATLLRPQKHALCLASSHTSLLSPGLPSSGLLCLPLLCIHVPLAQ